MELVSRKDLQEYASRNTSPQMPIEQKYVLAFLDALMNSTSVQYVYEILRDEMQNGDAFVIFNSYHVLAKNVNKEPYRSIVAYAMLKKDFRLFELISSSMFTGSVAEYHGEDLYTEVSFTTDEHPTKYTDSGIMTDMTEGKIQIGFKNWYCDDPLPDGTGSEYQTIEELEKSLEDFGSIITLTKPARVEVLLFFIPYCFLGGNSSKVNTCNIDTNYQWFSSPFGDPIAMNILYNTQPEDFEQLYADVSMNIPEYDINKAIDSERRITFEPDNITFDYDFRTEKSAASTDPGAPKDIVWGRITIRSGAGGNSYAKSPGFAPATEYFEKYTPLMLRINDSDNPLDPDLGDACIALEIENDVPTVGAMFFTQEKA